MWWFFGLRMPVSELQEHRSADRVCDAFKVRWEMRNVLAILNGIWRLASQTDREREDEILGRPSGGGRWL